MFFLQRWDLPDVETHDVQHTNKTSLVLLVDLFEILFVHSTIVVYQIHDSSDCTIHIPTLVQELWIVVQRIWKRQILWIYRKASKVCRLEKRVANEILVGAIELNHRRCQITIVFLLCTPKVDHELFTILSAHIVCVSLQTY